MVRKRPHLLTAFLASLLVGLTPNFAAAKAPTDKTLLWEISGNGLAQPSYLFGTIHSGCAKNLVLSRQQQQAIAKSQQLYLEIDLNNTSTYIGAGALMLMPGGQSLRDVLTGAEYHKVKNFFEGKRGIPMWTLVNIRPFYLSAMVGSSKPSKTRCVTDSRENFLMREAKKYNMAVHGLETPEEVNDVQNSIPMRDEVALLLQAIDNYQAPTQNTKAIDRLNQLYAQQDIAGLHRLIAEDPTNTASDRVLWQALLDRRNRQWLPNMRQAMATKPTFFGVGAGHLGGDAGLISLLQAEGYTVRPVFDKR
jgi:uncharacterized protein